MLSVYLDPSDYSRTNPITSLLWMYASSICPIAHSNGIKALTLFLDRMIKLTVTTNTLIRLAELLQTLQSCEFNGKCVDQNSGVAMGINMELSYVLFHRSSGAPGLAKISR